MTSARSSTRSGSVTARPSGPTAVLAFGPSGSEGEANALAERRLESALRRFRALGADVIGGVGDTEPLQTIADVLRDQTFDEIILSTLPAGMSRWLRQDLLHRVQRNRGVPVTHVVGEPETAEPGT